ncbi:MAG: FAD-dependent oxidoreductase [Pseudomonadota bacterium]|nr:FAD-dependent oxidoreductase [Pseudomonadota bacterium]
MKSKVLVIGGGIVGLASALKLLEKDFEVSIIDAQKPGAASNMAGGILFPLKPWEISNEMLRLCIDGISEYNIFFDNLDSKEKTQIQHYKRDTIVLGNILEKTNIWYSKNTITDFKFYKENLNKYKTVFNENFNEFLLLKDINIVDPGQLKKYIESDLKSKGVNFISGNIDNVNNLFEGSKNKEFNSYDYIVVTAGAWSSSLLNLDIEIKPIKGQLLFFKSSKPLIENIIFIDDYYMIPRSENILVVGSTLEDVGFDISTSKIARDNLSEQVYKVFNKESNLKCIDQISGFRPFSDIGEPYICKHPGNPKIIFNFGHFRYGILTAFSSASKLINLI